MNQKRDIHDIIESFGIDKLSRTPHGYKGCCDVNPNHTDRKPSMHIHLEKGMVKCFSCGAFRPLFDYLIDKGTSFDEAVDYLFTDFKNNDRENTEMQEYILGRAIPKSMVDRGILPATLRHFRAGYDTVEKHLTIPLEYNSKLYGIKYRQYPKKFWYSDNFVKDNFIYNYAPTEERFYTEGEVDTWMAWQNGTKNISALLSAHATDRQLELMSKHKVINLALDNDIAGFVGAFRINEMLRREVEINVVPFPGKDIGEQNYSEWQKSLKRICTFTEFEVEMISRNYELYEEIHKRLKI